MPSRTSVNQYEFFYENYVDRKSLLFGDDRTELLGGFEGFAVFSHSYSSYYSKGKKFLLMEVPHDWQTNRVAKYKLVMYLDTSIVKDECHISYSYLVKKYRKQGLSHKFYRYLIVNHNINLVSGNEQSKGGKSIWTRLSLYKDISIKLKKFDSSRPIKTIKYKPEDKKWDYEEEKDGLKKINSYGYGFLAKKVNKRGRKPSSLKIAA